MARGLARSRSKTFVLHSCSYNYHTFLCFFVFYSGLHFSICFWNPCAILYAPKFFIEKCTEPHWWIWVVVTQIYAEQSALDCTHCMAFQLEPVIFVVPVRRVVDIAANLFRDSTKWRPDTHPVESWETRSLSPFIRTAAASQLWKSWFLALLATALLGTTSTV